MKNYKERQNRTSGSFEEIFRRALELSPGDRAILIDRLLQSLDAADREQVDAAWREEIERRMQAVDEGRVELTPGEEVLAQLRSRFSNELPIPSSRRSGIEGRHSLLQQP